MASPKDSRIAMRLTREQDALIRHAADVEGTTVTDFAVSSAVTHARDVLADRRVFTLDAATWTHFIDVLDRPVMHKPALEKLLAEPEIWDDEYADRR